MPNCKLITQESYPKPIHTEQTFLQNLSSKSAQIPFNCHSKENKSKYSSAKKPVLKFNDILASDSKIKSSKCMKKHLYYGTISQKQNLYQNNPAKIHPSALFLNKKNGRNCNMNDPHSLSMDTEFIQEEIFTVAYSKTNSRLKKPENWFSRFITPKNQDETRHSQSDDQFEIIKDTQPGPSSYNISHSKENNSTTFPLEKRFKGQRPITAQTVVINNINNHKKVPYVQLEHVSFGTSLNNLRSEIKKIEYCQWKRTHCRENIEGIAQLSDKNTKNYDPSFISNSKRFPVKTSYSKKDFYNFDNKKIKKSKIPAHYFMSQAQRSPLIDQCDERDYHGQDYASIFKEVQNFKQNINRRNQPQNHDIKQIQEKDDQFGSQFQQIPKNTIGQRPRKVRSPKSVPYHPLPKQNIDNIKRIPAKANEWIKPSYNIKFQI